MSKTVTYVAIGAGAGLLGAIFFKWNKLVSVGLGAAIAYGISQYELPKINA